MKKNIVMIVVAVMLSFIAGGWYFTTHPSSQNILTSNLNDKAVASEVSQTTTYNAADIVEQAGPAVVYIEATGTSAIGDPRLRIYGFNLPSQTQKATGTGFIIQADGYILTNQHVVDGAQSISVKVQGNDTPYTAKVVGADHDLDLAVLKIDASDLPTLAMGDSDIMRSGDPVIAIGNPLGLDHTVTTGVISAKGRPITIEDRNYRNLIQTDAAINSGNSGGPLINMAGQAIAINTAVSTSGQGIGFAIPINTAKEVINLLISNGKVEHPFLGISMTDLNDSIAAQFGISSGTKGVVIVQVENNSAASAAGLKAKDILLSIDGQAMTSTTEVQNYIAQQSAGQTIQLEILRGSNKMTLTASLGSKS